MPEYMGKHFAYNKKGYAAYRKAKKKPSNRKYSQEAIMMAKNG